MIAVPKLLWVALPLLLVAALLAVAAYRGRLPSRHALNVGFSLLLLVYVAVTAGLGIFWVANQQLPVFDWHYLFGYGTVLLLGVHLAFNARVVWRFLTRRRTEVVRAAPGSTTAAAQPSRRGWLAAAGALAAVGAAYLLGQRQGRGDLALTLGGATQADGLRGATLAPGGGSMLAFIERFHAVSSHSRAGALLSAPVVDWGMPPAPFKAYEGARTVPLPRPGRSRTTAFDLGALGDVLWHTSGVTERRGGLHLRASPSSGAFFSTELYLAVRAVRGLAPGLWHYDPRSHGLSLLDARPPAVQAWGLDDGEGPDAPAAWVVATAVFRRTGQKYRDRTYRYVLADLGHALENLRVAAAALGIGTRFAPAFDEAAVAAALGLDEAEEGVLALAALAASTRTALAASTRTALAAPAGAAVATSAGDASMPRLPPPDGRTVPATGTGPAWSTASTAGPGAALGVTAAMHAATSLRARSPEPARPADAPPRPPPADPRVALPPADLATPDWLGVIARRRSVRRYTRTPLPVQVLSDVLARMAGDRSPLLSAAVRVHLVVHDVGGIAPGAYRYDPGLHALALYRGPPIARASTRAAGLDQDVIGDAAVVFVLSIDRTTFAADPHGPARGYRHALLESGLVGERVYLEAAARGLGACAVGAFYDDEASALLGIDPAREWVVHFAALGMTA